MVTMGQLETIKQLPNLINAVYFLALVALTALALGIYAAVELAPVEDAVSRALRRGSIAVRRPRLQSTTQPTMSAPKMG